MASPTTPIEQHPDIAAMRMRYDEASETPRAQVVDGLTFLVGLFLAASAWIVGFNDRPTLAVTNLIAGIALAVLAASFASAYGRTHGISWVAPVIGLWTIFAPWLVAGNADSVRTVVTNVIVGIIALLLGLAAMAMGRVGARRSGLR